MVKNADLHTHSHYSDGQISPKDLVRLAKKRGVKNLALTDHNSVKGVREAIAEGKKIGVNIIAAVEIREKDGEVLGYFIDIKNKDLIKKLKRCSNTLERKIKDWCKKLKKGGYDISFKELQKKYPKAKGNINEFYVLYSLYKKGYGPTLELSKRLFSDKRLRPKKIRKISKIQAIKLIIKAGGVPVWAHPWINDGEKSFKYIKSFVKAGLKGIEINNGDRSPFIPKSIKNKIRKIAKKYDLILTSGSDFHGKELVKLMPGNHDLGKNNCDEKTVEKLKRLAKR